MISTNAEKMNKMKYKTKKTNEKFICLENQQVHLQKLNYQIKPDVTTCRNAHVVKY